jgi:hypothetical protein
MKKLLPLLYARNSNGSVQQWQMVVDGDSYYSIEGLVDGKQTQNSPTVAKIKNADKANATTVEEQALKEATAKWQKKLDKGYYQDVSQIDKPKFVECMLCKSYGDYKDKLKFPVFSQPTHLRSSLALTPMPLCRYMHYFSREVNLTYGRKVGVQVSKLWSR